MAVNEIIPALKRLTNTGKLWQRHLFGNNDLAKMKRNPSECLQPNNFNDADTEEKFRRAFFANIAFDNSARLQENCRLEDIAAFLRPNENVIIDGINPKFTDELHKTIV